MKVVTSILCIWLISAVQARGFPPKISVPQGNRWAEYTRYVRKGNSLPISCEATASPKATYYWTANGKRVTQDPNHVSYDENTGVLTLGEDFDSSNDGDYQCIASNEYGKAMTPFLSIKATRADAFPGLGNVQPEDREAFETDYVMLECKNVPKSVPPWVFSWKYLERKGNDKVDTQPVEITDRMVIDKKGNLHILWTEMSDNEKVFACSTLNEVIKLEVTNTHTIKLAIKPKLQVVDRDPLLVNNPDVTVYAGEPAELQCIFTYYASNGAPLEVVWMLRGEEVYRGQGPSYVIQKTRVPDETQNQEGEYMCEANVNGKKAPGKVHLKIVAPPQFIPDRSPTSKSVPVEKDAVYHCEAASHNSYIQPPVWLINAEPLLGCPPRFFECKTPLSNGLSQCINEDEICNNLPDCSDKSDEESKLCNRYAACPESMTRCRDECISNTAECKPVICNYPAFLCHDESACLTSKQICDGTSQCKDGSDEIACANGNEITRKRFRFNSQRTQLTLPNVRMDDKMCFQCMVTNEYGTTVGDGCLTVIDKIVVQQGPNSTYNVEPGYNLVITVDATTDILYQNQIKYRWYWYEDRTDPNTGVKSQVPVPLPPSDFIQYILVSQNGKQIEFRFPDVDPSDEKAYDVYYTMKGRPYSVVIEHKYDRVEVNFTINGSEVIKPVPDPVVEAASTNLWFIALILAILILFIVVALIVCYMYRNRGGTYPLDKKEHQAGHDPEQELKENGFHDVGRIGDDYDDKPHGDEASLSESVKPYESDDDPTEEYGGDFDVSKFNEDGSFIGLYGDKKSKYSSEAKEATV